MKKILAAALICLVVATSAFAETTYNAWDDAFKNSSPFLYSREYEIEHALFSNPAELAGRKFQLSIPVSASIYNAAKLLSGYQKGASMTSILTQYVGNVGLGEERLGTASMGVFVGGKGLALGFYSNVDLKTIKNTAATVDMKLSPMACAGFAFGYGFRLFENNTASVDIGATLHADVSVVVDAVSAKDVLFDDEGNIKVDADTLKNFITNKVNSSPKCLGVTLDLGTNVGLLNDSLILNVAATDIPLFYKSYDVDSKKLVKVDDETKKILNSRWDLACGAMFKFNVGQLNLAFSADYFNIVHADYSNYKAKTILAHTNFRATANIAKMVKGSAALNAGDLEFDVGFDLFGNEVDLVYKVLEFGTKAVGEKTVDSLTVRMRLGFDSNNRVGK